MSAHLNIFAHIARFVKQYYRLLLQVIAHTHTVNCGKLTSTFVLLYKHFEQHVASEMEWWEGGAAIWFSRSVSEYECSSKNSKIMKSFAGLAGSPLLPTPIFVNSLLHIVVDFTRK